MATLKSADLDNASIIGIDAVSDATRLGNPDPRVGSDATGFRSTDNVASLINACRVRPSGDVSDPRPADFVL